MSTTRQKGMAVIGALMVVAAASVATAAIMERQSLMADTLAGERDRVQAKWLLRGGLDWARVILVSDARNNAVTLRDAIWAQPIAGLEIRTPDGNRSAQFSGVIEDEQGKYNLQRLGVNGVVQGKELAALQNLLARLGIPSRLAAPIATRVAASQISQQAEATAPALRSAHDLLGIDGMDLQTVAILSDYVTVLPRHTGINVNTASAEVLSAVIPALSLDQARALTDERTRGQWFNSRGDFVNRLGDAEMVAGITLEVRSDWFKVSGEVVLEHARVGMRALLHRSGDAVPAVRWIES